MCVVTQTVERVARELRESAKQFPSFDRIVIAGASKGQQAEIDALWKLMMQARDVMRASAKLLDGKD